MNSWEMVLDKVPAFAGIFAPLEFEQLEDRSITSNGFQPGFLLAQTRSLPCRR